MIAQLEGLITFDDKGQAYFTGFKGNKMISVDPVNSAEDLARAAKYAKSQGVRLPKDLLDNEDSVIEQINQERTRVIVEGK